LGSEFLLGGVNADGTIEETAKEQVQTLLRRSFRPEFLNRLDEIVFYKPLTKENVTKIIDLQINQLNCRLENQQIRPGSAPFDLSARLTECLLGFETVWEEKKIGIEPDIQDEVIVESDRELLSIVWNNLLSNAFKFTEPGGTVSISLKRENDDAVVTVRDSGCGMPPETVRHIFDKFYQGDTSHSVQGNGLGLALVKRIIDIAGGEIRVESTPGEGSTFIVQLRRDT
jgi:signal transduction histidine kinase